MGGERLIPPPLFLSSCIDQVFCTDMISCCPNQTILQYRYKYTMHWNGMLLGRMLLTIYCLAPLDYDVCVLAHLQLHACEQERMWARESWVQGGVTRSWLHILPAHPLNMQSCPKVHMISNIVHLCPNDFTYSFCFCCIFKSTPTPSFWGDSTAALMQVYVKPDFLAAFLFPAWHLLSPNYAALWTTLNNFQLFSVFTLQILVVPGGMCVLHEEDLAGIQKNGKCFAGKYKMQLL